MWKPLSLIVAVDEYGGFGKDGKIPWNYPEDLKRFKKVTNGSACIMGKYTYDDMYDMTLARKKKSKKKNEIITIDEILPGRESYVVTKTDKVMGATAVPTIRTALEKTKKNSIFVIGGYRIYVEALPFVNKVYMTLVEGTYQCDRIFPVNYLVKYFKLIKGEKKGKLKFLEYRRK